jgi:DNA-binding GntR family transcriptional regulator
MALDPDDSRPPYVQVAAALRAEILVGLLKPGAQLPSRVELAKKYEVAPMTVQSALRELRDDGLIVSRQGSGVFVRNRFHIDATTRIRAARRALDEIHAPMSAADRRCRECRDALGRNLPWPCRTWQQIAPVLDDQDET